MHTSKVKVKRKAVLRPRKRQSRARRWFDLGRRLFRELNGNDGDGAVRPKCSIRLRRSKDGNCRSVYIAKNFVFKIDGGDGQTDTEMTFLSQYGGKSFRSKDPKGWTVKFPRLLASGGDDNGTWILVERIRGAYYAGPYDMIESLAKALQHHLGDLHNENVMQTSAKTLVVIDCGSMEALG